MSAKEIILNVKEPNYEYREDKNQIIIYNKDEKLDFLIFDKEEKFLGLETFEIDKEENRYGMILETDELRFIVKQIEELGWLDDLQ